MNTPLHKILPLLALSPLTALPTAAADGSAVGQFAEHGDIGGPAIAGSTTYDESLQEYHIAAGGQNIWTNADQFQFAWKKLKGDFLLRARFEFVGEGGSPHRKLGLMARSSLDPDATYVDACAHGNGEDALQFRAAKGGNTEEKILHVQGGDVLQLERRGKDITFSAARYGEVFESVTLNGTDLGDEVYAGIFLCAHDPAVKEQAVFREVRIIKQAAADFRPYHDYIGSQLEVLHVFTGRRTALYRSKEPFEAPNWKQDGKTLLWNVSGGGPNRGVLRTYDLTTGTVAPFNTGAAIHNNNDHVLSFDGKMLGVSNQAPENGGKSCVYTLPAAGGAAKQITPIGPSYLHGWSIDGKWLVFTGGRQLTKDGPVKYDIYKVPAEGGPEVRLTDSPGLNDGPEFSPDGKYIYFNSTRTGLMQIWRMKTDGSEQERVTNDELNDWFPHISPDGKWIVFISFGQDVQPSDHPYYKHVYLRLMPVSGGEPRVIAYVYGGQGTINVPSWSPDSSRVAFVSNSDFE
ncbi:MAG TPA: biopolymer transporter TolR [Opitutus sp.]|nr:biopolymer transporter TolR [Opitutus sp.]